MTFCGTGTETSHGILVKCFITGWLSVVRKGYLIASQPGTIAPSHLLIRRVFYGDYRGLRQMPGAFLGE